MSIVGKLRFTIIFTMAICLIILSGVAYTSIKNFLIDNNRSHTVSMASMAASQINGETFSAIGKEDGESDAFNEVMDVLNIYLAADEIEYIYTMKYDENGEVVFVVDSDPEEPADLYEPYGETTDQMLEALAGKAGGDEDISTDEWGSYISGYAPIYNGDEVVGIVGVDCEVSYINKGIKTVLSYFLIISVVCLFVGIVVAWILGAMLNKNFVSLNNKILEVASDEGDLSRTLDIHSGDELEVVGNSLNQLLNKTRDTIQTVKTSSGIIWEGSSGISDRVSIVSEQIENISLTVSEMTDAMDSAVQQMNVVGASADEIYQQSVKMKTNAEEENALIADMKEQSKELKGSLFESKDMVQSRAEYITAQLNQKITEARKVEEIQELTQSILSIAAQTSLLALNANIEAAHAGEMGRGFAVVAGEIGQLAQSSSEAASEIRKMGAVVINVVNELADLSSEMMSLLTEQVLKDYTDFAEFGDSYLRNAESVMVRTNAFLDQAHALEENMLSIKDAVSNLVAYSEENAAAMQNVDVIAKDLRDNMEAMTQDTVENQNAISDMNELVEKYVVE